MEEDCYSPGRDGVKGICGFASVFNHSSPHATPSYFKVNATYTPPEGFLLDWPPPAAMTTYCFPSTM